MTVNTKIVNDFISEQLAEWHLAADNFTALKKVIVKELFVDGMKIKVQFNPARIVSSAAKIDTKSIKERKCFLCDENRPVVQRGIVWGNKYMILVNPFPIFPRHLTIPDIKHVDQLIKGRIADMISLACDLDGYTVFYNGPKCGASAPDHMHFQAGNSDFLTIGDVLEKTDLKYVMVDGDATLFSCCSLPLNLFVIDAKGPNPNAGERLFARLYDAMPIKDGETEPMMNILCYATATGVRLVVIPRKRHRPSFYGTEGEDKMVLSPASVDMGGVFITPLEKDFKRLDADLVKTVFDELCLDENDIAKIVDNIN